MITNRAVFGWALLAVTLASSAHAAPRFQRNADPILHEVVSEVRVVGSSLLLDASALFDVPAEKLVAILLDVERYDEYGLVSCTESHLIARPNADRIISWGAMSAGGRVSKDYLEVTVHRGLPNGATAAEWRNIPRQAGWAYSEDSLFRKNTGYWYVEPQANGSTYLRYVAQTEIKAMIPATLIRLFAGRAMQDGVEHDLKAFAEVAR